MVHHGIEYEMMAAIAEGLNIVHNANLGDSDEPADAEIASWKTRSSTAMTSTCQIAEV